MSQKIIVVASLFMHPGRDSEFRQFETEAARIMQKHGGRIEHVIRPRASSLSDPSPHEIHIVSFPDLRQFEAYREDPELATLAPLRQSAIARTDIVIGNEGEPYL